MDTTRTRLTAQDIMTREPECAELSMTIRQLARLFEENEISGCPVVNAEGRVVGVVSRTDLFRRCSEGTRDQPPGYLFEVIAEDESDELIPEPLVCVEDFMTEDAATVTPRASVEDVAALMVGRRIHRVVVVDQENFPVGIITTLDLLGVFPGVVGAVGVAAGQRSAS